MQAQVKTSQNGSKFLVVTFDPRTCTWAGAMSRARAKYGDWVALLPAIAVAENGRAVREGDGKGGARQDLGQPTADEGGRT